MRVEPFQPFHVEQLASQGVQPSQISHVPASCAKFQRPPGPAVTAFEGDRIMICGGILMVTEAMGMAWALVSKDAGRHMLWLHRATHRFMDVSRARRIEATVEEGFSEGCRWAEMLGFEFEGRMRGYGNHGETHLRYGWVRG